MTDVTDRYTQLLLGGRCSGEHRAGHTAIEEAARCRDGVHTGDRGNGRDPTEMQTFRPDRACVHGL